MRGRWDMRCKYRRICENFHPLLSACNQDRVNEWCVQYVTFEEERGNAPYFALKELKKLRGDC